MWPPTYARFSRKTDLLHRLTRHLLKQDEGDHWPEELDFVLIGVCLCLKFSLLLTIPTLRNYNVSVFLMAPPLLLISTQFAWVENDPRSISCPAGPDRARLANQVQVRTCLLCVRACVRDSISLRQNLKCFALKTFASFPCPPFIKYAVMKTILYTLLNNLCMYLQTDIMTMHINTILARSEGTENCDETATLLFTRIASHSYLTAMSLWHGERWVMKWIVAYHSIQIVSIEIHRA